MLALLDFPDEILDTVFANLLPEERAPLLSRLPFRSHPPAPVNLLHCRLVCHSFDRLACPWAFRRIVLALSVHVTQNNADSAFEKQNFLVNHPRLAIFVRILSISFDVAAHSPFLDGLLDVLHSFIPVFNAMMNLRALLVGAWHLGPHYKMDEVLLSLFCQPDLHTVILEGVVVPHLSERLPSVKHVHIREVSNGGLGLTPLASCCECLSIGPVPTQIPWGIVRELSIQAESQNQLTQIADNFLTWVEHDPYGHVSLQELCIRICAGSRLSQVETLLRTFQGQSIRSLQLWSLQRADSSALDLIGSSFPSLEDLTFYAEWVDEWDDYLACFVNFPHLTTLRSNYFCLPSYGSMGAWVPANDESLSDGVEVDHPADDSPLMWRDKAAWQLAEEVQPLMIQLATVASALASVQLSFFPDEDLLFLFERDDWGKYRNYHMRQVDGDGEDAGLFTSSWRTDRFRDL